MLSPDRLVEIVDDMNERALKFNGNAWVSLAYWAHEWTATIHFLELRGRGNSMEDALDNLAKALTDRERRDMNVAKTIGIETHA